MLLSREFQNYIISKFNYGCECSVTAGDRVVGWGYVLFVVNGFQGIREEKVTKV